MLAADEPASGWSTASPRAAGTMSRRKQAKPQHLREEEEGPARTRVSYSDNGMLQKRVRIHLDFFFWFNILSGWNNESN
jgi:hypothetical protein